MDGLAPAFGQDAEAGRKAPPPDRLLPRQSRPAQKSPWPRGERDENIRAAYKDDLPMKAIAQVMAMSHQWVSQIVRS
jgi:hypothetical protein